MCLTHGLFRCVPSCWRVSCHCAANKGPCGGLVSCMHCVQPPVRVAYMCCGSCQHGCSAVGRVGTDSSVVGVSVVGNSRRAAKAAPAFESNGAPCAMCGCGMAGWQHATLRPCGAFMPAGLSRTATGCVVPGVCLCGAQPQQEAAPVSDSILLWGFLHWFCPCSVSWWVCVPQCISLCWRVGWRSVLLPFLGVVCFCHSRL